MTNNIWIGMVAGFCACGLVFPLNYATYECFKIKDWMKMKWKNFMEWEPLKNV